MKSAEFDRSLLGNTEINDSTLGEEMTKSICLSWGPVAFGEVVLQLFFRWASLQWWTLCCFSLSAVMWLNCLPWMKNPICTCFSWAVFPLSVLWMGSWKPFPLIRLLLPQQKKILLRRRLIGLALMLALAGVSEKLLDMERSRRKTRSYEK